MPAEIVHTLDLDLRLIDTATGALVAGRDVVLLRNGERVHPMTKGGGDLIFLGLGREDFDLSVAARGYEPCAVRVRYGELDPALPQLDLHLIPGRAYRSPYPCLTLEGRLPGVSALRAVRAGDSACLIRSFDPRKKRLTIFNPHHLGLDRVHYALVDPDAGRFEPFRIVSRLDDQQFQLDRALETPFGSHFPICPLVFGRAGEDGRYCLRVRDDAGPACWIVGWSSGEDPPQFKTVDFRRPETLILP